jgi:hypothetical protein
VHRNFRRSLELEGWSRQSAWGFDEPQGSYFAHLWRDHEEEGTAPSVWISGHNPRYSNFEDVYALIVRATGASPLDVYRVMHFPELDFPPQAPVPALPVIRNEHDELLRQTQDDYLRGSADALAWVLGDLPASPVFGRPSPPAPDADEVKAERWGATAAIHQRRDRPQKYWVGVEIGLWYAYGGFTAPY